MAALRRLSAFFSMASDAHARTWRADVPMPSPRPSFMRLSNATSSKRASAPPAGPPFCKLWSMRAMPSLAPGRCAPRWQTARSPLAPTRWPIRSSSKDLRSWWASQHYDWHQCAGQFGRPRLPQARAGSSVNHPRGIPARAQARFGPCTFSARNAHTAPADLPQAAIGPGMGIFSRYRAVLEPHGSPMTVKTAL